jgi:hypothetical protein
MNRAQRASQIWSVLAWCARHRQNMTYGELAQATGAFTGGLGQLLEPIQSYCLLENLPPLTVLVVRQETGLPGPGFTGTTADALASAQAKVFEFNWLDHGNPGEDKLEAAVKAQPSNAGPLPRPDVPG